MSIQRPASIEQAVAMFEALPNAAEHELQDMMGRLGRDILAIQRERVARATGALAAGLSSQLLVDEKVLRLKVGLLGVPVTSKSARRRARKSGSGDPANLGAVYYGRFVEFGRMAQTVLRKRRQLAGNTSPENLKRRVRDKVGTAKELDVAKADPRPFVNPVPDGAVDTLIDARLQAFLDRVMAQAEAA